MLRLPSSAERWPRSCRGGSPRVGVPNVGQPTGAPPSVIFDQETKPPVLLPFSRHRSTSLAPPRAVRQPCDVGPKVGRSYYPPTLPCKEAPSPPRPRRSADRYTGACRDSPASWNSRRRKAPPAVVGVLARFSRRPPSSGTFRNGITPLFALPSPAVADLALPALFRPHPEKTKKKKKKLRSWFRTITPSTSLCPTTFCGGGGETPARPGPPSALNAGEIIDNLYSEVESIWGPSDGIRREIACGSRSGACWGKADSSNGDVQSRATVLVELADRAGSSTRAPGPVRRGAPPSLAMLRLVASKT